MTDEITGGRYYEGQPDLSKVAISDQRRATRRSGKYQGKPTVRVTFAGCNLICGDPNGWETKVQDDMTPDGDGATWVCSAIEEWRDPKSLWTPEDLVEEWKERGIIARLDGEFMLTLTGGEPLITDRQDDLTILLDRLYNELEYYPTVEIHTNGTFEPKRRLRSYVNHFTVSPKLQNSGMPESKRINSEALRRFNQIAERGDPDSWDAEFQFVFSERKDGEEIRQICRKHELAPENVAVVPADGLRRDEDCVEAAKDLCVRQGFTFRPRLGGLTDT